MGRPARNSVFDYEEEYEVVAKNLLVKCNKCSRVDSCPQFAYCIDCTKNDPILSTKTKKEAPSLQTYGKRVDEILPIEPLFVAVDSAAIRFFSTRPIFKSGGAYEEGRWTTGYYEDMLAVLRYDYLEGLFDIEPFRSKNEEGLDFSRMIAEI